MRRRDLDSVFVQLVQLVQLWFGRLLGMPREQRLRELRVLRALDLLVPLTLGLSMIGMFDSVGQ